MGWTDMTTISTNADKIYVDNTKLSDYKVCPRYYYLRHIKGWRPGGTAMPLIFGLCWHEAMNIVWVGYASVRNGSITKWDLVDAAMLAFENCWTDQGLKAFEDLDMQDLEMLGARTPMIAKEMLINYIEKREDILNTMELIAAERPFAVPLYPDRTDIWYIGRRDKDVKVNGDIVVIEHKTTSEYKIDGGFKSQYLESFYPNSQVEGYLYAANIEYGDVRYVWADTALVHKKVHNAFRFIPISATITALNSWLWETRDWVDRIQSELERLADAEAQKILTAFPRSTNQCVGKYGLCSMLPICRGFNNPATLDVPPPGFIHDPWNPFDLLHISTLKLEK